MPDSIGKPLFHISEEIEARREFSHAFGEAMAAWARLEGCLFYWFMSAVGLNEHVARAIFFSSKSFRDRCGILRAVSEYAPFDLPTKVFLRAGIKKARQYSEFRNRVAHGEPVINLREGSPSYKQYVLAEGRSITPESEKDAVTIEHLNTATRNLNELRRLLFDLHPAYRPGYPDATPQAYRGLVLALPNQAHSTEPARNAPQDE